MSDPLLAETRSELDAIDRALLDLVNRRLELVRRLHVHKVEAGLPLRDMAREEGLLDELVAKNDGTLSEGGVRAFFTHILDLIRKEIHGS